MRFHFFVMSFFCLSNIVYAVDEIVDLELVQAGKKFSVRMTKGLSAEVFSVSNEQGETATIHATLEKIYENSIVVSFITTAIRIDKSTRSSHPVKAELALDATMPVVFDIIHGGLLLYITPHRTK